MQLNNYYFRKIWQKRVSTFLKDMNQIILPRVPWKRNTGKAFVSLNTIHSLKSCQMMRRRSNSSFRIHFHCF